jgi:hypothetical protein
MKRGIISKIIDINAQEVQCIAVRSEPEEIR